MSDHPSLVTLFGELPALDLGKGYQRVRPQSEVPDPSPGVRSRSVRRREGVSKGSSSTLQASFDRYQTPLDKNHCPRKQSPRSPVPLTLLDKRKGDRGSRGVTVPGPPVPGWVVHSKGEEGPRPSEGRPSRSWSPPGPLRDEPRETCNGSPPRVRDGERTPSVSLGALGGQMCHETVFGTGRCTTVGTLRPPWRSTRGMCSLSLLRNCLTL